MSNEYYYIQDNGINEGPFDPVTLLRKIRAGRIAPDTMMVKEGTDVALPAMQHPELAPFFHREAARRAGEQETASAFTVLGNTLNNAWRLVTLEPTLCVISGAMVLVTFVIGWSLSAVLGLAGSGVVALLLFFYIQTVFFAFTLRLNRGQRVSEDFLQKQLTPSLLPFAGCAAFYTLAFLLGTPLLILPGLVAYAYFVYTSFCICDRKLPFFRAHKVAVAQLRQQGPAVFGASIGLSLIFTISLLLILPLPFILPMVAAGFADLYDKTA